jgi:hypothetical protein
VLGDLDALGIDFGQRVAVAVVRVDPAGNNSAPSAPVCVVRRNMHAAADACRADPDCKEGLSTCAVGSPAAPTSGGAA